MPVRLLSSSVLVWPTAEQVHEAARNWAQLLVESLPVAGVGYVGSYARGDWGVGSDLDLIVVLESAVPDSAVPESVVPESAGFDWKLESLPVPAEVRLYRTDEWNRLLRSDLRMAKVVREETVWLVGGTFDYRSQ